MPHLTQALPKYRKHRASGQALVELNGRRYYLGPRGTKASKLEYDRLIAEWLQHGRQIRPGGQQSISVIELIVGYVHHARGYYRKDGNPVPINEDGTRRSDSLDILVTKHRIRREVDFSTLPFIHA